MSNLYSSRPDHGFYDGREPLLDQLLDSEVAQQQAAFAGLRTAHDRLCGLGFSGPGVILHYDHWTQPEVKRQVLVFQCRPAMAPPFTRIVINDEQNGMSYHDQATMQTREYKLAGNADLFAWQCSNLIRDPQTKCWRSASGQSVGARIWHTYNRVCMRQGPTYKSFILPAEPISSSCVLDLVAYDRLVEERYHLAELTTTLNGLTTQSLVYLHQT